MSSIIDALYELKYNPFEYGTYLASFYTALGESENNLLLAPLVVPLCSHPVYGKKLQNSNTRSSIWSVFNKRVELYDLQERINEFKTLTEQCIQYCLVNEWLSINEQRLTLSVCIEAVSELTRRKSAENLGRLFHAHSPVEIYAFLGARPQ